MGLGGQHQTPATLPAGRHPVHIVQETGLAPGPVCTGAENLQSHRDSVSIASSGYSIPSVRFNTENFPCGNLHKEEIVFKVS